MNTFGQGAEAIITKTESSVIKKRIPKTYRIPQLDVPLRKSRAKREVKILKKVYALGIPVPKVLSSKEFEFEMEFVDGVMLKEYIIKENYKDVMVALAKNVALLHKANIIHGDLTTSNMMQGITKANMEPGIYFIDFGLGFVSQRVEDKAVDLHLFRQALNSYHHEISETAFAVFSTEYRKRGGDLVLDRLEEVEKRGKNKNH